MLILWAHPLETKENYWYKKGKFILEHFSKKLHLHIKQKYVFHRDLFTLDPRRSKHFTEWGKLKNNSRKNIFA